MRSGTTAPTREVWVIATLTRPKQKTHIRRQFDRQTWQRRRLVIVARTDVPTPCIPACDTVLFDSGAKRQGGARNVGMDWALDNHGPEAIVSFWDDDDFYGPRYLEEQMAHVEHGVIVGKTFGFTRFDRGIVYFPAQRNFFTRTMLIGGTIGGYLGDMPFWTDGAVGEDTEFSAHCRRLGKKTYVTSGMNWLYDRSGPYGSHAFRAGEQRIWMIAGGKAMPCGDSADVVCADMEPLGPAVRHKEWANGTELKRHRVPPQA